METFCPQLSAYFTSGHFFYLIDSGCSSMSEREISFEGYGEAEHSTENGTLSSETEPKFVLFSSQLGQPLSCYYSLSFVFFVHSDVGDINHLLYFFYFSLGFLVTTVPCRW